MSKDNVVLFNQQRRIKLWNDWLQMADARDKANPNLPSEVKFINGMAKGMIGEVEHEGAENVHKLLQDYIMENAKAINYTVYDLLEIVTPEEDNDGSAEP